MRCTEDIMHVGKIVSLRVQHTFFGPRAEIARERYGLRFTAEPPAEPVKVPKGRTAYRRVRRAEVIEVALFQAQLEAGDGDGD